MSAVKSKGTTLEAKFKLGMDGRGLKGYSQNNAKIFGCPDFIFKKAKLAIFLDSCFWHGCSKHLRMPSAHQDYWQAKIERNRKKDRVVSCELRGAGWTVLRIWEHSLNTPKTLRWWLTHIEKLTFSK